MSARYTLKVIVEFAAAHSLRDYPGDCSRLHGHNWKVEVEVTATALDRVGIAMDFKTIRGEAKAVVDALDHQYLNEMPAFAHVNATAENIAAHLYGELSRRLNTATAQVSAITVWETERACVRYSESTAS